MMSAVEQSLQGQLLLASPALMDPNFARSVILIVQHTVEGALGLVLNRPLDTTIERAWEQVGEEAECGVDGPIFQGGPCEGPVMVLHGQEDESQEQVLPDVYFSAAKEQIERLVAAGEEPIRVFVGYAGWSNGQLEREMEEGAWLPLPASADRVFADPDGMWERLLGFITRMAKHSFIDPKFIPDDPSLN
jgi:putative transcriptional regulator